MFSNSGCAWYSGPLPGKYKRWLQSDHHTSPLTTRPSVCSGLTWSTQSDAFLPFLFVKGEGTHFAIFCPEEVSLSNLHKGNFVLEVALHLGIHFPIEI